jgi:hypothetical protein
VAHETPSTTRKALYLPVSVASPADVGRLVRELETINDTLLQLGLRKGGEASISLPKTTYLMDQLISLNELNLLQAADRRHLQQFLLLVRTRAPQLHISFGADPSPSFLEKLVVWFRREIHPQLLLNIGLQPTIGAGCIVRTANHQFDCSLQQNFTRQRDLLIARLAPETEGVA